MVCKRVTCKNQKNLAKNICKRYVARAVVSTGGKYAGGCVVALGAGGAGFLVVAGGAFGVVL